MDGGPDGGAAGGGAADQSVLRPGAWAAAARPAARRCRRDPPPARPARRARASRPCAPRSRRRARVAHDRRQQDRPREIWQDVGRRRHRRSVSVLIAKQLWKGHAYCTAWCEVLPFSIVDTDEYGLSSGNVLICLLGGGHVNAHLPSAGLSAQLRGKRISTICRRPYQRVMLVRLGLLVATARSGPRRPPQRAFHPALPGPSAGA